MSRLTRDGTAEPVSRDRISDTNADREIFDFSCSADHEQDWQPYPVDPYSCYMCDHTYCCVHRSRAMRILLIYSTQISTCTAESYIQLHSDWLQVQRYNICTVWYICTFVVFIDP